MSSESFVNTGTRSNSKDSQPGSPPNAPEFDPSKGYLRYRAELEYGKVVRVLVQIPSDWSPVPRDLRFFAEKHAKVPRAVLEVWADSLDGPTKGLVVKTEYEFDTEKGYLRYRARLEYGKVIEVLKQYPPDWHPEERDLTFIAAKHSKVPKAFLEFWAQDSLDGPTKGPVVKTGLLHTFGLEKLMWPNI